MLAKSINLQQPIPLVMGILNVTPDSFSDGGKFVYENHALKQVEQMIIDGAKIIDIGGESTRPGALDVDAKEEIIRVIPLLKAIKSHFDIEVSIDTSKAEVMAEAIIHGADMINDVRALQNKNCIEVIKQSDIPICLMHMQGMPRTMQNSPLYGDMFAEIKGFFNDRIQACEQAGIDRNRVILDVGFGFGKTLQQNYQLLAKLSEFSIFDIPLLVGISRKSMIGDLLHRNVENRLAGSVSAAIIATQQGAKIIRVHDVQETVDALKVLQAVNNAIE